ncbi:MAG: hypothetical protein ACYTBS_24750 [Planctomycetota bacterium]|jgi:hypothetical protein
MKKTAKSRGILGPPNPVAFRHLRDAARSLQLADAAYVEAEHLSLRDEMDESASLTKKRSFENRFREELWQAANRHRRSIKKLEEEFFARWFVWRAVLPISSITGIEPTAMLRGRRHFQERSLAIWIARTAGNVLLTEIGRVIDRDHSSVIHSFKRAEADISERRWPVYDLLIDTLELESEWSLVSKD